VRSDDDGSVAELDSSDRDSVEGTATAYAAAVSHSSNVGYYDLEGRFLYATPALAAYVGMTSAELLGRTWYEIGVPPEAVDRLEAARRRVLESGHAETQKAGFAIGGSYRETEFLIKPVLGADGSITGTAVAAWDASEQRLGSRGRTRLDRTYLILNAMDQVILRARDSNVLYSEACRITAEVGGFELAWVGLLDAATGDVRVVCQAGRDEGLLSALAISSRDEPSGHGVVGTSIRENRTVVIQDVRNDARMDAWRPFFDQLGYKTAAGFPIRVDGRPIGALVMYSIKRSHFDAAEARLYEQLAGDISAAVEAIEVERARAAAQKALSESERRYRDLFEKIPLPLAVYDTETLRFLAVNDATMSAYGYSRDEFLAMTLPETLPPEDVPAVLEEIEAVVRDSGGSGYRPTGSWRQVRHDGSIMYSEVFTHDILFDGRSARLVAAIDVSERRRLETQLAEATRLEAMGHLAGGIAHDFNNLLTAVNGYADILIAELEGDARADSAREIRRAGARAADLTKQVLAFARKQDLAPRPVDMNAVVDSVAKMLHRLIGEQIELVTKLDESPAVVRADPGQLEQVLVNLAVNSRDAMPDGGVLEIAVRRVPEAATLDRGMTGPAVLLTVTDSGTGMDELTLSRAFEPFFTTKESGHGTGLGLATVHGIVHQSSGRIWVESVKGTGTTVSVLLPFIEALPEPVQTPRLPATGTDTGSSILVVEDDSAVRAFVVATLEHAGYRVMATGSSSQAAALAEGLDEHIDLLLTDVVMPGGNGQDLADRLLVNRPSMRVVLMSGYDSTPTAGRRNEGFVFLPKPFGANELTAAVRQSQSEPERPR
jgi:two-component system, cell cycle sensor histidine kinase and response regulator CckA